MVYPHHQPQIRLTWILIININVLIEVLEEKQYH